MIPKFVILTAGFNCAPWIEQNLFCSLAQTYPDDCFRILYTDDASSDRGVEYAKHFIEHHPLGRLVSITKNTNRLRGMANHLHQLSQLDPEEIAVFVEADDYLAYPDVLQKLATIYNDPNIWVTYGSFQYDVMSRGADTHGHPWKGLARPFHHTQITRHAEIHAINLRTVRKWLVDKIDPSDFTDDAGQMLPLVDDLALFWPCIEMAGVHHSHFVDDVLINYRCAGDSDPYIKNEWMIEPSKVASVVSALRKKPIYVPLASRNSIPTRSYSRI